MRIGFRGERIAGNRLSLGVESLENGCGAAGVVGRGILRCGAGMGEGCQAQFFYRYYFRMEFLCLYSDWTEGFFLV